MILKKKQHTAEYAAALRIVRAALPAYAKHSILLAVTDSVTLSGRYWSGGSRATYTGLSKEFGGYAGGQGWRPARQFPGQVAPPFGPGGDSETVTLSDTYCVVESGVFCGRPATAHLFITEGAARAAGVIL